MRMRIPAHVLATALSTLLLAANPAVAQVTSSPCDQGVIRLPDRTGTVQICSALSAQVPALAKQLGDAVRLLGSQQQQLRELTRLVRALNGSSGGLDAARQTLLLRNLSAELGRAEQRGPESSRRTVEELSEQLEVLRDQLVGALSRPNSAAATSEALRGRLGDSIAQLELRSATGQLDGILERIKQVQADLGTVRTGVAQANDKLDRIASVVESANALDGCRNDLACAIFGNSSVEVVARMVANGVRVPPIPGLSGSLLMSVVARPTEDREQLLTLMLRAGLDPQIRLIPAIEAKELITAEAVRLADVVVRRTSGLDVENRGQTTGPSTGIWNKLAMCLSVNNDHLSLSEVAALLGDTALFEQSQRLGFAPPRPQLVCDGYVKLTRVRAVIVIDAAGVAGLPGS